MLSSSCLHVFFFMLEVKCASSHRPASDWCEYKLYQFFHAKNESCIERFFPEYKELFFFSLSWKVDRRLVGSDFDLRSGTRHHLTSAYWKCSPREIHQHLWVRAAGSAVPPFSRSVSGCDVTNCDVRTRTTTFKWHRWSKRCFAVGIAKGFKLVLKLKIWSVRKTHFKGPVCKI